MMTEARRCDHTVLFLLYAVAAFYWVRRTIYTVSKKTVQKLFCQKLVKFHQF